MEYDPTVSDVKDKASEPAQHHSLVVIRPRSALRNLVHQYFSVGLDPEPRTRRVVPDGSIDLIFNLSDKCGSSAGGNEPQMCVVGVLTAPVTVERPAASPLFGVSLAPGGASVFLNVPPRSLKDRVVDLRDIWGAEADDLLARLRRAPTPGLRAHELDTLLMRKLAQARPPHPLLAPAIVLIRAHGGRLSMRALADELSVSERLLERVFAAATGLSPKEFSRVARMQTVLAWLARAPTQRVSWVELAYELGFADQAHLIREFRALTGVSPSEYARDNGVSYVFNDHLAEAKERQRDGRLPNTNIRRLSGLSNTRRSADR